MIKLVSVAYCGKNSCDSSDSDSDSDNDCPKMCMMEVPGESAPIVFELAPDHALLQNLA